MDQIGNFLKVGEERILISNLVRYRKRKELWRRENPEQISGEEIQYQDMVGFSVDIFHKDSSTSIINVDSVVFSELQTEENPQAEADADLLLAELDEFFTGYKAKDGYGEPKP